MTAPAVPILKWAGGKRSLIHRLLRHAPEKIRTYHEPFAGGAALFFALRAEGRFQKARLNDSSARLMRTYAAVQRDVEGVIRRLRRMPNEEAFFLRQRMRRIDAEVDQAVAAWMIYLNRTCFNGLYRENRRGEFNTPFGRYEDPTICNAENLRAASAALRAVKLSSGDFRVAALHARPGDFVYLDPPYYPRTGEEFTTYGAGGFGHADHVRLRDLARALRDSGVRVLVSNSDVDAVRELYADFLHEEVAGRRSVGANGLRRGTVGDLLIW